ncbi:MAG: acyl carrier protein [Pseudohongiella sp.]|nr:acyl carrier protein [Pseudohongiella sp.]
MPEFTITTDVGNRAQVFRKLCDLLQATPGVDAALELNDQTLIADLAMDSLRLVEIIFEMERHFDVAADEGLMAEARTLGDVVSLFSAVPEYATSE